MMLKRDMTGLNKYIQKVKELFVFQEQISIN